MRSSLLALFGAIALLPSAAVGEQALGSTDLIRDVAAGGGVLVVKADGSVVTWGRSPSGAIATPVVIELPDKVLKVAVGGANLGGFTGYALLEDGTVVAWGDNDEAQLGNGVVGADLPLGKYPKPSLTPVRVTGLADIIDIAAGNKNAVALRKDGTVWAWGSRAEGALGGGDAKPAGNLRVVSAMAPVRVPGLDGITQIAVSGNHSLALTRDGHVMSWGTNHSGELGLGTRFTGWTPARVVGLDSVVAIAAGNSAGNGVSGALRQDGTVWMWGVNSSGMMGNGERPAAPDAPGGRILVPLQVKGIADAKQIAIGGGNVAAVMADGTLRTWGHNGYGESGTDSANSYELRPVKVTALTNVASVYLGNMRAYAVRADGSFWIWGFPYTPGAGILAKTWKLPTRLDLP
jgi:alpha-tubulin suppressor-like RCC1 family protein